MTRASGPSKHRGAVFFFVLPLLILALVLTPALVLAQLLGWWRGTSWDAAPNLTVGLICSLVTWLFVAVFHLRAETTSVCVGDRAPFLRRARRLLNEMGYEIASQSETQVVARPGFQALLLGGSVRITLGADEAQFHGPRISLERLRKRLRFEDLLGRMHNKLEEERPFSQSRLKRVELALRLTPGELAAVAANVLAPLAEEADVRCELVVSATSARGIPEHVVDQQIRGWLEQQGIDADIHKDHVQFNELLRLHEAAPQELSV